MRGSPTIGRTWAYRDGWEVNGRPERPRGTSGPPGGIPATPAALSTTLDLLGGAVRGRAEWLTTAQGVIGFDDGRRSRRSGSRMQGYLVNAPCKPIGADSKRTDFALAA